MKEFKVAYLAWLGINYGSTLQAYALYTTINSLGYRCEVIGADHFIDGAKPNILLLESDPKKYDWALTKFNFNLFMKQHFVFNKILGVIPEDSILKPIQIKEINNFSAFVCGSDQIWKPGSFWFKSKQYLQFAPTFKRVAYAPSVGWRTVPENFKGNIGKWKEWLTSVPYLSARESSGAALIEEMTGRHTENVVDPTMLLTSQEWLSKLNAPKFSAEIQNVLDSGKKFLLAYFLDFAEKFREVIKQLSVKLDLEIVWLTGRDNVGPVQVNCAETDPAGFVHLINRASLVCVDGFHGTCFSLNFSKPVVFFTPFDSLKEANDTRIIDLFQRFGVNPDLHVFTPNSSVDDISLVFEFDSIQYKISDQRLKSISFLKNSLAGASEGDGDLYRQIKDKIGLINDNYSDFIDNYFNIGAVHNYSYDFIYDHSIWDSYTILGCTRLIPKIPNPPAKKYAYCLFDKTMLESGSIIQGHSYRASLEIKFHTSSSFINIHLYSSLSKGLQIIYRLNVSADVMNRWLKLSFDFVCDANEYDSFMVGALQISGDNRFISFRHILIAKK